MNKRNRIIYWIATVWLALGMIATGIAQLLRIEDDVKQFMQLGYPPYLMVLLGGWKILGVAAILAPGMPRVKEWAYAGFFFTTTGAIVSHLAVGDPLREALPSTLLLVLTIVSWASRPAGRTIAPARIPASQ